MKETISNINKEWKQEQNDAKKYRLPIIYPRIYSNQYYAYVELIRFFGELKSINQSKDKQNSKPKRSK